MAQQQKQKEKSPIQQYRENFLTSESYKKLSVVFLPVMIISIVTTCYIWRNVYATIQDINQKSAQLKRLENYDINFLKTNPLTRDAINSISNGTINDIINLSNEASDELTKYDQHIQKLQKPYTDFLQYAYLPSLNIRKNPYTQQINTQLIGLQFLETNPFNDIQLLQKRSDFFKYVGENDEFNEITDLKVGDIEEDASWLYSIPITVNFTSPSKRAFLLLVDKLSLTSNQSNIALLNEFFYYLWEQIKENKSDQIKEIIASQVENSAFRNAFLEGDTISTDKIIGYSIYQRVFKDQPNTLIDDAVLDKTIKQMVVCSENEPQEKCYFRFRDRLRSLSSFAYVIWSEAITNKVDKFKEFLKTLPAIISIDRFTFDKLATTMGASVTASDKRYVGRISMRVFWRWISDTEIQEIAQTLGKSCSNQLQDAPAISVDFAIQRTEDTVRQLSNMNIVNQARIQDLLELRSILWELQTTYPGLSNYHKAIKTFELYRMMSDVGLCK